MGVGVPRPVLVGAVAHRLLVNVHALPRWNHSGPSETVGAFKGQKSKLLRRKLSFPAALCLLRNRELVSIVTKETKDKKLFCSMQHVHFIRTITLMLARFMSIRRLTLSTLISGVQLHSASSAAELYAS